MKHIYAIGMLLLCTLFIGCSDNDDPAAVEQAIKVTETTAKFDAFGGTGTIKVEAADAISAKSDESWCTVTVAEHTIQVTTAINATIVGRTAMVTITSGAESIQVPVYQAGDAFECNLNNYAFDYQGGSCSFTLKTTRPDKVKVTVPEWISYKVENNTIVFTAKTTVEGDADRTAEIKVTCGEKNEVTANFSQTVLMNFVGTYNINYTNNGKRYVGKGVVTQKSDNTYAIALTGVIINTTITCTFDSKSRQCAISAGQFLGYISPYAVYLCAHSETSYLTADAKVKYVSTATFNKEGKVELTFTDSGTWSGQKIAGLLFAGYDKLLTEGGAYKTYWGFAHDIVMVKQ